MTRSRAEWPGAINRRILCAVFAAAMLLGWAPMTQAGEKAAPLAIGETFTIDSKILGEKRRING
jgi:hypothetical protein